jgi:hypothetical protein
MKSYLRKSKASKSTVRKVDRIIAAGWKPGQRYMGRGAVRQEAVI